MKALKKFLVVVFLILTVHSINILSQEMVSYKILRDEPDSIYNLYAGIEFLGIEILNVQLVDLTFGLNANYDIKNIFYVFGNYRRSFFSGDILASKALNNTEGNTKVPRFNMLELGGAFNLINFEKSKTKVVLETRRERNMEYEKYIKVPHKGRVKLGVRGGLQIMNSPVYIKQENTDAFYGHFMKYSMKGIFIGVQRTKDINLYVKTENYGENELMQKRIFGIDFTMCTFNFYNKHGNEVKFDVKNLPGFRLYWLVEDATIGKLLGFYLRAETGFRPGFVSGADKIGPLDVFSGSILEKLYGNMALGINFRGKL